MLSQRCGLYQSYKNSPMADPPLPKSPLFLKQYLTMAGTLNLPALFPSEESFQTQEEAKAGVFYHHTS